MAQAPKPGLLLVVRRTLFAHPSRYELLKVTPYRVVAGVVKETANRCYREQGVADTVVAEVHGVTFIEPGPL